MPTVHNPMSNEECFDLYCFQIEKQYYLNKYPHLIDEEEYIDLF